MPGSPSFSVRIRGARLSYAAELLFSDLDLTLRSGEWTCLLGPSGVGKTSLLRTLLGLERAAEGSVSCSDGRPLTGRAAYMAQRDLLLPWMTATENVALGRRLRGGRLDRACGERANQLLRDVGLDGAVGSRPDTLSGGMRQRVALARTLFEDRPVVLMDEPFASVDAITRIRLQELAGRLLRERTVLLVTHDPLDALRLGHRVLVMTGRPARLGEPIVPNGSPPRPLHDPQLLELQAELLDQLAGDAG